MMSKNDFREKQIIIVNLRNGDKLSFSNDNILVKDVDGVIKYQSTCHLILAVMLIGNITITNSLIIMSKKFGFSIFFLSGSLKILSCINNGIEGNTLLHRKQYDYNSLEIGKRIIMNKIETERQLLMTDRNRPDYCNETIGIFDSYLLNQDSLSNDFYTILSIEGICAKRYYQCMFRNHNWKGRRPRTKCDMINTCMDLGYTVLFNYIDILLSLYDFDKYVGVFHKEFWKRKSLVCDLMEPFRCIIDKKIVKSINLKQINLNDFKVYEGKYLLNPIYNAKYLSLFIEAILEYKEHMFDYIQKYYRAFVKGIEIEKYPWFKIC